MARFKLSDRARLRVAQSKGSTVRVHYRATMPGRNRRAAQRQPGSIGYTAGTLRRSRVGGCVAVGSYNPRMSTSIGYSGGSTKRVPPPTRPAGRFGGRGIIGYRYPGSRRIVRVGGTLVDVGKAKCVPCQKKAIAARG
jgi:hypothetical protein